MKKIIVKLSFLTVLSGLYLAGLTATAAGTITPGLRACCSGGGGATCCGVRCTTGPDGCTATGS